jgi:membrane protein YdbS with pleckstrin-like domain
MNGTGIDRNSGAVFVVRPVFIPRLVTSSVILVTVFFTTWLGIFLGITSLFVIEFLNLRIPSWAGAVVIIPLILISAPIVAYRSAKRAAATAMFSFFSDRVEYITGVRTIERKTVPFTKIAEVSMRQSVAQRRYGVGTLVLAAIAGGDVTMPDVPDVETVYRKVRELVKLGAPAA